jgi:hypothetical protein
MEKMGMKVYCWINRQADKFGVKFKKQTQQQTRQNIAKIKYKTL